MIKLGALFWPLLASATIRIHPKLPMHLSTDYSFVPKNYSIEEIQAECSKSDNGGPFNFAEVMSTCGSVYCLNAATLPDNTSYLQLSVSPNLEQICEDHPNITAFGAFSEMTTNITVLDEELSTVFVLNEEFHSLLSTHDYIGCVHLERFNTFEDGTNDTLLGVTVHSTSLIINNVSVSSQFRIWDYNSDCHNTFYNKMPIPIGKDNDDFNKGRGVALYVKKGQIWLDLIVPSTPDFDNPTPVDQLFRQDKCVYFSELQEASPDDEDFSSDFAGEYSCLSECQSNSSTSSLALVSQNICYCTTFDRLLNVHQLQECDSPCTDDPNFSCGGNNGVSVYYVDPSYGENAGYKYWQCVNQLPYNPPEEVLAPGLVIVETVDRASQCFSVTCKAGGYSVGMIRMVEEQKFECVCIVAEFYAFQMQDFSHFCIEVSFVINYDYILTPKISSLLLFL
jgi:hypothetical protein